MATANITIGMKVSDKLPPKFEILNSGAKVCKVFGSYAIRKGSGENAKTTYVNCEVVFWNNAAEVVQKYVKGGAWIFVTGVPEPRAYIKDGEAKVVLGIDCKDWGFIGDKGATTGQGNAQANGSGGAPAQSGGGYDDDIPF